MGLTAEKVAQQWKVSREAQDAFALASHQKALKAQQAGEFADETTPVEVIERFPDLGRNEPAMRSRTVSLDEGPRPDTSLEGLARLRPVFAAKGSVTAGNSSGIVDGSALVAIGSEQVGKDLGLTPRARIVSVAVSGADPTIMLTGPAPASRKALAKAGIGVEDLDLVEINEAFAAVVLRFAKDMDIDLERVNVNGGAIALGHPLGATGAMILGTLIDELERRDLRRGLATLCVGGGMGIATIVERV
jgi:acetyl-CoA acyltransferase